MEYLECSLSWLARYKDGIISLGVFLAAAASIAGTYMSGRASHRSRVSELRERWIDEVRGNLVDLSEARIVNYRMHENRYSLEEYEAHLKKFKMISTRMKLLLNANEPKHQELLELIDTYIDMDHYSEMNLVEENILNLARSVFREEWKRIVRADL